MVNPDKLFNRFRAFCILTLKNSCYFIELLIYAVGNVLLALSPLYIFYTTDFVPTKSMLAKIIPLNFSFSEAEKCTFSPELNNHLPKEKKLLHIYKNPPKVLETKHFRRIYY